MTADWFCFWNRTLIAKRLAEKKQKIAAIKASHKRYDISFLTYPDRRTPLSIVVNTNLNPPSL